MGTMLEKSKIIECFRLFNNNITDLLNSETIDQKFPIARGAFVDLQSQQICTKLTSDIQSLNAIDQIMVEIENSLILLKDIESQNTNKQLDRSTKTAIHSGVKYIRSKLVSLKSEMAEKLQVLKSKSKSKFDDIQISEKEFSLFIILGSKYGLFSSIPKANDRAAAFSALTNISEQSIRECIGSKYQLNPHELLLKKENLAILKETLLNICSEIDLIKDKLTY